MYHFAFPLLNYKITLGICNDINVLKHAMASNNTRRIYTISNKSKSYEITEQ